MIELEGVTAGYGAEPVLRDVTVALRGDELTLVVGPTGSGKSTLLRVVADPASAPLASGRLLLDGQDLAHLDERSRRGVVGYVPQDPLQAVDPTTTVEDAVDRHLRRRSDDPHRGARRREETLDLLDLAGLRARRVAELSGGQQQRVAIAAALAAGPRLLVLDEPTSALDPVAAEEVLAILHRLVHDVGTSVLVAEHRLERVVHHADRVLVVGGGSVVGPLEPAAAMATAPVFPPVVALGRALGWDPLPLSVRSARRSARGVREQLRTAPPAARPAAAPTAAAGRLARTTGLGVVRGEVVALRSVDLVVHPGEAIALMGRNGSGKSTLFATLAGLLPPSRGRLDVPGPLVHVPQDPSAVLTAATVQAQLAGAADVARGCRLLDALAPGVPQSARPAQLSQGQQMSLALATVLAGVRPGEGPTLVLLDEPTRGLDYPAKAALAATVRELAAAGHAVVVATHDVELAAELASRVVVLAEGEVVTDTTARRALADSPAFAPQVAKVVHPAPYLTVTEVLQALERSSGP